MLTNIQYILLTAIRDRLFFGLFFGVIFATFIAATIGDTAMLEPQQMTLSLSAASMRVILMVGLVVFVCFHLRAAFQTREIDVLLSRPISRANLVISYWLGFACVATILVIPSCLLLYLIGLLHFKGFLIWSASLLLEAWLIVALSLFAGFTLRSAVSAVLTSLGFYVLSRMIGFFVATAQSGMTVGKNMWVNLFRQIMEYLPIAIPRLDFFAKTEWLIYGAKNLTECYLFAAQAAVFIPLLIAAAVIDFKRRQF